VREYVLGDFLEVHSFLPKSVIETGVECAVDLEELVEVGETDSPSSSVRRRAIMRRISNGSWRSGRYREM
jgi:hypothetical protein